jgi:hypothetical protein
MNPGSAPPIAAAIDFNGARRVVDVGGGAGGLLCAVLDGTRLMVIEAPLPEERSNTLLDWFLAFADLNVMVNNGGREREYRELLAAAGLEVTAIHDAQLFSAIEAAPRR